MSKLAKRLFVIFTPESANSKTGPIPVSTSPKDTCPDCDLKDFGCYASQSFLGKLWSNLSTMGGAAFQNGKSMVVPISWKAFCDAIAKLMAGQVWRHNQAGDLPGENNKIDRGALLMLVAANEKAGARGLTYTHYPLTPHNAALIAESNRRGFTVNLSANTLQQADDYMARGLAPVVTLLPHTVNGAQTKTVTTPAGNTVVVCPATYRADKHCDNCELCAVRDRRVVVGFPGHGASKARVTFTFNGKLAA